MQVVIMAGGKGTRISSVASDIPKPMIPVCDKPILEHEIECLRKQGLTEIILVVGHLGHIITEYFGDGNGFGVSIDYIVEETPLGTAGALYYLKDRISDDFLLLNGDIIFDVDFSRFLEFHKKHGGKATILTHPNNHPYDSGIIVTDNNCVVTNWLHKEDERTIYKNRVNAGMHILSPEIFSNFEELRKLDLDRDILKPLIEEQKLIAYDSPEYVKDMGTPERYEMVIKDIESGLVRSKNLKNKQKAIFLDRDGTINVYKGFIRKAADIELIDGVAEAIGMINRSGYLVIIVTNQPVVARGECTFEEVELMNDKIETLLGEQGVYIDDVFYCPHHTDKGFEGERPELKFECDCRKPKPGMLLKAAEKYNIDLEQSFMIGDSMSDVNAGLNAGCKPILLGENEEVISKADLKMAVRDILKEESRKSKIGYYMDDLLVRYPILKKVEESIQECYEILVNCYQTGHKLLIAGNGGSAADAEHMVGELMKGFVLKRQPDKEFIAKLLEVNVGLGKDLGRSLQGALPAIALSNHQSLNTAFMNDVEGDMYYAQQVYGYGKEGDVFLGISTSGNAKNIEYASIVAKAKGMKVIGLSGKTGGRLKKYADTIIIVPEMETFKIQELHLPIYHTLCLMLEETFFDC